MTNETMQAVLLQMQQQNQLIMELLQESSKGQDPDQTKKPVRMELLTKAGRPYGLSYQFMKRLCAENRIIYVRSGRRIFVNLDSLEDFLRKGEGGAD